MEETTFTNKCAILADLWINYRNDEEFEDFIEYADIGLPLSYFISSGIVETSPKADLFITETWDLFLSALDIQEDTGFENLDEVLDTAGIE